MADRTSKLNLQYIVANQSQKEVTINADLNVLDMLVQATAKGIANAPPETPAEGDMYIIGEAPVGAWEGRAKHLAGFFAGVWLIVAPRAGWRVWLEEGTAMRYQTGIWVEEINIHPHSGWFFIFGHSPYVIGGVQVRLLLACQPCTDYLPPINGSLGSNKLS